MSTTPSGTGRGGDRGKHWSPVSAIEAGSAGGPWPASRGVLRLTGALRANDDIDDVSGEFGLRDDDFDALTDLFMGDQRSAAAQPSQHIIGGCNAASSVLRLADRDDEHGADPLTPPIHPDAPLAAGAAIATSTSVVEVLLLAHLPVLASAWAVQYARDRSLDEGRPVGVVRMQGGRVTVEVVAESGMSGGAEELAMTADGPASLDGTLWRLRGLTDRWIVRVEGEHASAALDTAGVDRVTVLTGTDDAAVAGGFKTLKQLAGARRVDDSSHPTLHAPRLSAARLRLVVVGGDDSRAELAARRLANAARAFLERDVEMLPRRGAIRSTRAPLLLFSGRCDLSLGELAARLRGSTTAATGPDVLSPGQTFARPQPHETTAAQPINGTPGRPAQPGTDELRSAIREVLNTNRAQPDVKENARATVAGAAVDQPELPGALASHIDGLTPVAVRSPYDRAIEFAVDDLGGVHLLAWVPHGAPHDAAACALMTAAQWADDHAELIGPLLSMHGRERGASASQPMTLHLMTDEPRLARRLLDTDFRVHLLDAVPVHGRTAWYCRALN